MEPCEAISLNVHALNDRDHTDRPQVTWDIGLGIGNSCELALRTNTEKPYYYDEIGLCAQHIQTPF